MGARDLADQEERKDGGADRLERRRNRWSRRARGAARRLGDKAVGRADEREGNDGHDLAGRTGKCETANACGNGEQAAKAQLPNAQGQRIDFFDKALGHDNVAGIDREQHDDRAGIQTW